MYIHMEIYSDIMYVSIYLSCIHEIIVSTDNQWSCVEQSSHHQLIPTLAALHNPAQWVGLLVM